MQNASNAKNKAVPTINSKLEACYRGWDIPSFIINLTLISLVFTITRFHDFSGMTFLGKIRAPLFFTILTGFISLRFFSVPWPKQLKLFFIIIIFEGIRGFFGYLVIQDFVVNDGWQFYTWRDLILHFFGFMLPITFAFCSGVRLRILISYLLITAFLLSIWSITHSGFGPGGYIGDENDNCLVLVSLLPLILVYPLAGASGMKALFSYLTALLLVLGIVATQSRGGFLGFVAVIAFQFWYSPNKIRWILGAFIIAICAFPFVPKKYYSEIESISSEAKSSEGTIKERLDTWSYILRMWKDPRNILAGVGLENTKWRLGEYETADRGVTIKSLSGRAAHSLYFQLLGDMGIWGIVMIGTIFITSLSTLRKILFSTKQIKNNLYPLYNNIKNTSEESKNKLETLNFFMKEFNFIEDLARAILCSWFGALGAALGVSVLYYPTVWFLVALSASVYIYYQRINSLLVEFTSN